MLLPEVSVDDVVVPDNAVKMEYREFKALLKDNTIDLSNYSDIEITTEMIDGRSFSWNFTGQCNLYLHVSYDQYFVAGQAPFQINDKDVENYFSGDYPYSTEVDVSRDRVIKLTLSEDQTAFQFMMLISNAWPVDETFKIHEGTVDDVAVALDCSDNQSFELDLRHKYNQAGDQNVVLSNQCFDDTGSFINGRKWDLDYDQQMSANIKGAYLPTIEAAPFEYSAFIWVYHWSDKAKNVAELQVLTNTLKPYVDNSQFEDQFSILVDKAAAYSVKNGGGEVDDILKLLTDYFRYAKYNSFLWNALVGFPDQEWLDEINDDIGDVSMFPSYYLSNGEEYDFQHFMAVLSAYQANAFDVTIDLGADLLVWSGDLLTVIKDSESNDDFNFSQNLNDLLAPFELSHEITRFGRQDFRADMDAFSYCHHLNNDEVLDLNLDIKQFMRHVFSNPGVAAFVKTRIDKYGTVYELTKSRLTGENASQVYVTYLDKFKDKFEILNLTDEQATISANIFQNVVMAWILGLKLSVK